MAVSRGTRLRSRRIFLSHRHTKCSSSGIMSSSGTTFETAADIQKPSVLSFVSSPVAAFSGEIEPARVTFSYKLGLALVAMGMALLAAVYVGLILLTSFAVYYHLDHNSSLLA